LKINISLNSCEPVKSVQQSTSARCFLTEGGLLWDNGDIFNTIKCGPCRHALSQNCFADYSWRG